MGLSRPILLQQFTGELARMIDEMISLSVLPWVIHVQNAIRVLFRICYSLIIPDVQSHRYYIRRKRFIYMYVYQRTV